MHIIGETTRKDPPVLLLHGAGIAGWMWQPVTDRLPGQHIIVPDLPGQGDSASIPFGGVNETVDALAALLRSPAIVVGFSWGGQLAIELTARFPERIHATVIVSALAKPLSLAPLLDPLIAMVLPLAHNRWFARQQGCHHGVPVDLMDAYVDTSTGLDLASISRILAANNRYAIPKGWAEGTSPVLVAHGSSEPRSVRNSALALCAARPTARLEVVEGARHNIPFLSAEWLAAEIQSLSKA